MERLGIKFVFLIFLSLNWVSPHIAYFQDDPSKPITIATLVPFNKGRLFSRKRVEPAMSIAVEKVREYQILTTRNLSIKFADSNCNVADGINEAINFYIDGEVDVFFGPCCDYAAAPVARQIKYWNIAMVTPGAMARDFAVSKKKIFKLMTRVGPNFNSLVQLLLKIFQEFDWRKVLLLYDPEGHEDIFDRYCHIAADGIHYGFRTQTEIPRFHQEYFKFDDMRDILLGFENHIGKQNSSKFAFCFPISTQSCRSLQHLRRDVVPYNLYAEFSFLTISTQSCRSLHS